MHFPKRDSARDGPEKADKREGKTTFKNKKNRKVGPVAVRLLLLPGIVEALVVGGVMIGVFGMPPLFAFAVGFVVKP
jgi:NhaP-type Na+/H+ or K+/H+ antiporter